MGSLNKTMNNRINICLTIDHTPFLFGVFGVTGAVCEY